MTHVLPIGIVREVELLVLVTIPIGSATCGKVDVITSRDEHTSDNRVLGLAEDIQRSEEVLPRSLKTVEEAANLARRHEDDGKFTVILEVVSTQRTLPC